MNKPLLAITMGDPAGIGPEVTRAALGSLARRARVVAYGPADLYAGVRADITYVPPDGVPAERDAIERGARDLASGEIDALVTAPVAKRVFGGEFPGHTELLAARAGALDFAMMLLEKGNVAVSPGSGFGPVGEGYLRMSLVENEARLAQAVRQIRQCLREAEAAHRGSESLIDMGAS